MQIWSNPISALNVCKSRKFSRSTGNWGRETRWWCQILEQKWKYGRFVHAQWKICTIPFIYGQKPKFPRVKGNWGLGTRWWCQILDRKWKYSCLVHNASGHNYWNCSVIVDLAIGQIPRSTVLVWNQFAVKWGASKESEWYQMSIELTKRQTLNAKQLYVIPSKLYINLHMNWQQLMQYEKMFEPV